ncbi:MAG: beta-galactosidase trimerization domain-containing protein [Verrucomicrobia bacterium]|nr:beta-galactosidase trimerization domain-containing protein [Verrucomicrobiota bacterium]MCH8510379.1 beta-galactosidase trimerization domain-containing protein [Kiritimatiellia bacterium]
MSSDSASDPFLRQRILDLTDTPMQRKLRKLAPMPVGAVFLPWPGMTEAAARAELRRMRETGFTCLKQTMPLLPEWPEDRILNLALDEGVYPFWYAEGGWEDITPELLTQLGLDPDMDIDEAMAHPDMIAHQKEVIRGQIKSFVDQKEAQAKARAATENLTQEELRANAERTPGVVGDIRGHDIHPEAVPAFVAWLKEQYGDVETLKKAWNVEHVGLDGKLLDWETWSDVLNGVETDVHGRDYRNLRDKMRFRADTYIREYIEAAVKRTQARDTNIPTRAGGEMGLFLPFASRGTDMEGIAEAMAEGGSFYPSIHLTWHFEEVRFEVARPVYMQAALTTDWGKGIWNATWESSGGPSWFSGGKSPFVPWAADKTPGHTCHAGIQSILMLSWLAAGYRGFGLWTWNGRTAGWETGEFMLLDRNNKITDRARLAGAIGKAARKYRRELWNADKEPRVGVLQDWENEALWAAMGVTGRDKYKSDPIRARIGASRALINGNIPWEHVTAKQVHAGLGPRYATIFISSFICLTETLIDDLIAYVKQGGRVVMDMPSAYLDNFGRLLPTGAGSKFETLFGVELNEYAYSRTSNTLFRLRGEALDGFVCDLTPTTAKVLETYDDRDWPAITENRLEDGTAVLLGVEAGAGCHLPGNDFLESLVREWTVGADGLPYRCDETLTYRLAVPGAEHYFFVNEENREVLARLQLANAKVGEVVDAVTGEAVTLNAIEVGPESARWIRVERND